MKPNKHKKFLYSNSISEKNNFQTENDSSKLYGLNNQSKNEETLDEQNKGDQNNEEYEYSEPPNEQFRMNEYTEEYYDGEYTKRNSPKDGVAISLSKKKHKRSPKNTRKKIRRNKQKQKEKTEMRRDRQKHKGKKRKHRKGGKKCIQSEEMIFQDGRNRGTRKKKKKQNKRKFKKRKLKNICDDKVNEKTPNRGMQYTVIKLDSSHVNEEVLTYEIQDVVLSTMSQPSLIGTTVATSVNEQLYSTNYPDQFTHVKDVAITTGYSSKFASLKKSDKHGDVKSTNTLTTNQAEQFKSVLSTEGYHQELTAGLLNIPLVSSYPQRSSNRLATHLCCSGSLISINDQGLTDYPEKVSYTIGTKTGTKISEMFSIREEITLTSSYPKSFKSMEESISVTTNPTHITIALSSFVYDGLQSSYDRTLNSADAFVSGNILSHKSSKEREDYPTSTFISLSNNIDWDKFESFSMLQILPTSSQNIATDRLNEKQPSPSKSLSSFEETEPSNSFEEISNPLSIFPSSSKDVEGDGFKSITMLHIFPTASQNIATSSMHREYEMRVVDRLDEKQASPSKSFSFENTGSSNSLEKHSYSVSVFPSSSKEFGCGHFKSFTKSQIFQSVSQNIAILSMYTEYEMGIADGLDDKQTTQSKSFGEIESSSSFEGIAYPVSVFPSSSKVIERNNLESFTMLQIFPAVSENIGTLYMNEEYKTRAADHLNDKQMSKNVLSYKSSMEREGNPMQTSLSLSSNIDGDRYESLTLTQVLPTVNQYITTSSMYIEYENRRVEKQTSPSKSFSLFEELEPSNSFEERISYPTSVFQSSSKDTEGDDFESFSMLHISSTAIQNIATSSRYNEYEIGTSVLLNDKQTFPSNSFKLTESSKSFEEISTVSIIFHTARKNIATSHMYTEFNVGAVDRLSHQPFSQSKGSKATLSIYTKYEMEVSDRLNYQNLSPSKTSNSFEHIQYPVPGSPFMNDETEVDGFENFTFLQISPDENIANSVVHKEYIMAADEYLRDFKISPGNERENKFEKYPSNTEQRTSQIHETVSSLFIEKAVLNGTALSISEHPFLSSFSMVNIAIDPNKQTNSQLFVEENVLSTFYRQPISNLQSSFVSTESQSFSYGQSMIVKTTTLESIMSSDERRKHFTLISSALNVAHSRDNFKHSALLQNNLKTTTEPILDLKDDHTKVRFKLSTSNSDSENIYATSKQTVRDDSLVEMTRSMTSSIEQTVAGRDHIPKIKTQFVDILKSLQNTSSYIDWKKLIRIKIPRRKKQRKRIRNNSIKDNDGQFQDNGELAESPITSLTQIDTKEHVTQAPNGPDLFSPTSTYVNNVGMDDAEKSTIHTPNDTENVNEDDDTNAPKNVCDSLGARHTSPNLKKTSTISSNSNSSDGDCSVRIDSDILNTTSSTDFTQITTESPTNSSIGLNFVNDDRVSMIGLSTTTSMSGLLQITTESEPLEQQSRSNTTMETLLLSNNLNISSRSNNSSLYDTTTLNYHQNTTVTTKPINITINSPTATRNSPEISTEKSSSESKWWERRIRRRKLSWKLCRRWDFIGVHGKRCCQKSIRCFGDLPELIDEIDSYKSSEDHDELKRQLVCKHIKDSMLCMGHAMALPECRSSVDFVNKRLNSTLSDVTDFHKDSCNTVIQPPHRTTVTPGGHSGINAHSHGPSNMGAIIGGVVGGVIFILLVILIVLLWKRKKPQRTNQLSVKEIDDGMTLKNGSSRYKTHFGLSRKQSDVYAEIDESSMHSNQGFSDTRPLPNAPVIVSTDNTGYLTPRDSRDGNLGESDRDSSGYHVLQKEPHRKPSIDAYEKLQNEEGEYITPPHTGDQRIRINSQKPPHNTTANSPNTEENYHMYFVLEKGKDDNF